jgi:polyferredoxin
MRMKKAGDNSLKCTVCGRSVTVCKKTVDQPIHSLQEVIRG